MLLKGCCAAQGMLCCSRGYGAALQEAATANFQIECVYVCITVLKIENICLPTNCYSPRCWDVPVVEVGDGPVPLLASRVPDLGPHLLTLHLQVVDGKLNTCTDN